LNGLRNGKGKAYCHHEILLYPFSPLNFMGFLHDEENKENENKKEKNSYVTLIFEGEYLNGQRYKGREYDDDGKLIYEGIYLNGERI